MKILIMAGEESGDLHGSHLVKAIKQVSPEAQLFAFGGRNLQESGATLVKNTMKTSVYGVSEVLRAIPSLLRAEQEVYNWLLNNRVDLIILIDFPGFHLKLLPRLSEMTRVFYYIPPKVWVWKENRKHKISKYCERVYTIFPFEDQYYPGKAFYNGHPLVDIVKTSVSRAEFCEEYGLNPDKAILGLVPGSRTQEIHSLLPSMIECAKLLKDFDPELQFVLPEADSLEPGLFDSLIPQDLKVSRIRGRNYDLIASCDMVLATSGTVTLESALLDTPMIIVNKGSWITYLAFQALSKIPYLGLPNIIADREICPEMLQENSQGPALAQKVREFLSSEDVIKNQKEGLREVRETLGEKGVLHRVAQHMLEEIA